MSDQNQQPQNIDRALRLRALWAAVLSLIFQGFILSVAIDGLARADFKPVRSFGYLTTFVFLIAFLGVCAGTVLIFRWKVKPGLNLVFYSGFLPAILTTLLYSGRGITSSIVLGVVSLLILFFIYPPKSRQGPFFFLVIVITAILAVEWLDPAYRAELPVSGQIGPIAGAVFLLSFIVFYTAQYWSRLQVRTKLAIPLAVTLLIILTSLTWLSVNNIREQVEIDEERQLSLLNENYNIYVSSQADSAASLAISLADREDIMRLYRARNRQGLLDLLTPMFNTLKDEYDIRHLYIEEPNGTVYVRVHNPKSFGDDITYRRTAATALELRQPVAGVEIGPSRLGVRGVAPMYEGSNFIGMVEVGIDYDETFIQNLKSITHADYTMWVLNQAAQPAGLGPVDGAPLSPSSRLFHYASTYPNVLPVSAEIYNQVLDSGIPQVVRVSDGQNELAVFVAPMLGYGDRIIGIFEIISSRAETLADIRTDTLYLLIIAIITAVLSLSAFWVISQFIILRPIGSLVTISRRQAEGDLNARVKLTGNDEFYLLGESLNTLSDSLQELVQGLETRVAERTFDLEKAVEQTEHRSKQLESVAEVANSIATIREVDQLLPHIVHSISERFGYYHTGIFLLDVSRDYAFLTAANSEGGQRMLNRGHRLRVGSEGIVGFVTHSGRPRVALDVGADAVFFDNPDLPKTRSEMALPLRLGEEIIGALDVQSTEPGAFSEDDIEVLSILADQIAIAIENARLFEDSRHLLGEAQITYGKSLQESWRLIHTGRQDVRYDYKGLKVQTSQEMIRLPEIDEASRTGKVAIREKNSEAPNTSMAIPLKVRGNVVGTMNIRLPQNRDLDPDEVDISEAVAERIGIAIEGAILLEESQRRAAKEQLIGDISSRISASINMRNVLQAAAEELGRVLPGSDIVVQFQGANSTQGPGQGNDHD